MAKILAGMIIRGIRSLKTANRSATDFFRNQVNSEGVRFSIALENLAEPNVKSKQQGTSFVEAPVDPGRRRQ